MVGCSFGREQCLRVARVPKWIPFEHARGQVWNTHHIMYPARRSRRRSRKWALAVGNWRLSRKHERGQLRIRWHGVLRKLKGISRSSPKIQRKMVLFDIRSLLSGWMGCKCSNKVERSFLFNMSKILLVVSHRKKIVTWRTITQFLRNGVKFCPRQNSIWILEFLSLAHPWRSLIVMIIGALSKNL